MRKKWSIRLGEQEWTRFTHLRSGPQFELIGSISRGPQIGALARIDGDRYVQVNGDFVSALNQAQIRRALALAQTAPARPLRSRPTALSRASQTIPEGVHRAAANQPAPVVIIKRRRRIAL